MPYPAISNQSSIRTKSNFQRYLVVHTGTVQFQFHPSVAASGKANAQITYSATLSGSRTNCLLGMTVLITPTSDYKADLRDTPEDCLITYIRKAPTSTILYISETAFQWGTSHFVTVLDDWRVHEKRVRVAGGVIYKDYDDAFHAPRPRIYDLNWDVVVISGSNTNYSPTPLAEAMTSGASISSWSWAVIENGVVTLAVSTSQNPTFTLDIGTHWLHLTVTDSAGRTNWFAVLVAVVPDTFDDVVDSAVVSQINYSLNAGNTAGLEKFDDASAIVPGSPCIIMTHSNFGDATTQDVVSMVGWLGGEVQLGITGDEQFGQIQTYADSVKGLRAACEPVRLVGFPMNEKTSPALWGDVTRLSVYDAIWYIGSEHSTAFNLAAPEFPSDYTSYRFGEINTPAGTLPEILDSLAERASFGLIGYPGTGELFFRKALLYESSAATRSAATVLATYGTQDGTLITPRRPAPGLFAFNAILGGYATRNTTNKTHRVYHSTAPVGFVPLALMEQVDSIILAANLSDSAAKAEGGALTANHLFAASEATQVTVDMLGGYHVIYPAPHIWHKLSVATTDTLDTMSFDTNTRLLCTEVSSSYDTNEGTIVQTVTLREETDGGANYATQTQYVPLGTEQAFPTYPIEQAYPLSDFDDMDLTYGGGFPGMREGWIDPTEPQEEATENQQPGPGVAQVLFVPFKGDAVSTSFTTTIGVNYRVRISGFARIREGVDGNDINFVTENGSFTADVDISNTPGTQYVGVWTTNVGWEDTLEDQITGPARSVRGIAIRKLFSPDLDSPSVSVDYNVTFGVNYLSGNYAARIQLYNNNVLQDEFVQSSEGSGVHTLQGSGAIDEIRLISICGTISGTGQDPGGTALFTRFRINNATELLGDAFYTIEEGAEAEPYSGQNGLNEGGSGIVSGLDYASDHVYEITLPGDGGVFTFSYTDPDGDFSDNQNKVLRVEVTPIT